VPFCTKCGNSVPDGYTFCGQCGEKINPNTSGMPLPPSVALKKWYHKIRPILIFAVLYLPLRYYRFLKDPLVPKKRKIAISVAVGVIVLIIGSKSNGLGGGTYTAIVTCSVNGMNTAPIACFAGSQGSPDTELELRTASGYGLYKPYQLYSLGNTTGRGLEIPLGTHFELEAQNASENLVLGVNVVDEKGKEVFEKQVARFGVINVKN
jgi:hypothetical protein